jgi:hypothetical protein
MTAPNCIIFRGTFAVSERVYTTEACDAPVGVYQRGLSCSRKCLQYRGTEACAARDMSIPQGPELHLKVSALQRPMLLPEVSTPQGHELHLDMFAIQRHMLHGQVSTPQVPELHLKVSAIQKLVLLL